MRVAVLAAGLLLAAGCSQGAATGVPRAETSPLPGSGATPSAPGPTGATGSPPSALHAEATVSEPRSAPPPEPAPTGGTGGVPSVEEQIEQCTRQTGLPRACEDKIRYGIP
ncbi:hypothetical protein GCM10023224_15170 [Streptomonospora halophila]|uniref:PT repeat-containing protein n=1 Tax=Streptomonospora halophila TaxID=427369 RepID=A0ABP9GHG0_9ACTN